MMKNFNEIKKLNEDFKENIESNNYFKHTKGLLENFGNYLSNNKTIFYGLLGATVFNIAAQSILPVVKEYNQTEISQIYKGDSSGLNLQEDLNNFIKESNLGNELSNIGFTKKSSVDILNEDVSKQIVNMKDGESIFVRNPFWENSVVEVKVNNNLESHMAENHGVQHQMNHENVKIMMDYSTPVINFNNVHLNMFLENFAESKTPEQSLDMAKYVLYHEAAHATRRQSVNIDQAAAEKMEHIELEMHSDVASLMLIGSESKDLSRFNYATDMVIKMRISNLDYISDHNTTYGLMELKQIVNKNPELLNIKASDISEFSYMFTKKIANAEFNADSDVQEMLSVMPKTSQELLEKVNNNEDMNYINYYAGKLYNKGTNGFKIEKFMKDGMESRAKRVLDRISTELNDDIRHDDMVAFTYMKNRQDVINKNGTLKDVIEQTQKELVEKTANKPIITESLVSVLKSKIKMDEMDYNVADIQSLLNQTNNNKDFVKKGIKFEI